MQAGCRRMQADAGGCRRDAGGCRRLHGLVRRNAGRMGRKRWRCAPPIAQTQHGQLHGGAQRPGRPKRNAKGQQRPRRAGPCPQAVLHGPQDDGVNEIQGVGDLRHPGGDTVPSPINPGSPSRATTPRPKAIARTAYSCAPRRLFNTGVPNPATRATLPTPSESERTRGKRSAGSVASSSPTASPSRRQCVGAYNLCMYPFQSSPASIPARQSCIRAATEIRSATAATLWSTRVAVSIGDRRLSPSTRSGNAR